MSRLIKNNVGLFIVIVLSFFTLVPFFQAGFFTMHDDTQVARVYEMQKALHDGMFPVRWVNDLGYGYGYPIFNFYAPLSYYLGGFISLFGLNSLLATKITFVTGILLAGAAMYFFAKNIWGELGGILSALFYQYATYHAVDIYVRGDLSEIYAYAFIPLVFLSFYKIFDEYIDYKNFGWVIIGSLSYAGVILSHNLTAMMLTPFLILFFLSLIFISKNKLITFYYLLITLFLGLALSTFYWLPALVEAKYTNVLSQIGGGADYRDHFVCLQQFWFSNWGFGGSTKGCIDGLSFMLGKLHIIFTLVVATGLIIVRKIFSKKERYILVFSFLGLAASLFIQLEQSNFIWDVIKPMAFFQYPWRFLILASFFSSIIVGGVIRLSAIVPSKNIKIVVFIVFVFLLVMVQSKFFYAQQILHVSSDYYTNSLMLFKTSRISDEYMPKDFVKPTSSQILISNLKQKTQSKVYQINNSRETQTILPIAYFPAWKVYIDGKNQVYEPEKNGIKVSIPSGVHILTVNFVQTVIEKVSNIVSLCGILLLILGIIYQTRQYEQQSR